MPANVRYIKIAPHQQHVHYEAKGRPGGKLCTAFRGTNSVACHGYTSHSRSLIVTSQERIEHARKNTILHFMTKQPTFPAVDQPVLH